MLNLYRTKKLKKNPYQSYLKIDTEGISLQIKYLYSNLQPLTPKQFPSLESVRSQTQTQKVNPIEVIIPQSFKGSASLEG